MREISGKTQVIAVALVTALCMLGDSMLYVVLPIYWREAGLTSLWEVGVLLSINRLVRVPLGPLVGKWYERTGGRTGLIVAVGLAIVTTLAYGFQGFWLWLVVRCLWGVAWTFLRLGAYSLIVTVSEGHNRGQLMGLYNGLYRLGSLGGMLGGALLVSVYGMSIASFVLAMFSLFAVILLFLYVRPSFTKEGNGTAEIANERSLWKQGSVLATMGTALIVTMVYQGMFASTLSRLIEVRQPLVVVSGVVVGAAVLSSLVQGIRWGWEPWAAPLFGKLSDRYGRKKMFIWTLIVGAMLFGLMHSPATVVVWFAILMGIQLTATIVTTVMDTLAADEAAKQTNSTALMTVYSVVTDLGAALGPLIAFWMDGSLGLDVMYVVIAVALLAIAIAWAGEKKWVKMGNVS
ncbi:MFS transporter [Brevibacillus sp. NRS-1366]|uniref:MFS transporter n=1 Tax=Brevibacillus sp. NRS-1366 TaxID=3233899 RepID=UPI003D1A1407